MPSTFEQDCRYIECKLEMLNQQSAAIDSAIAKLERMSELDSAENLLAKRDECLWLLQAARGEA